MLQRVEQDLPPEPEPVEHSFPAPPPAEDLSPAMRMEPIDAPPPPSAADGLGESMPDFPGSENIPFEEPAPPPPPVEMGEPSKPIATSESQYPPQGDPLREMVVPPPPPLHSP